jgi:hypothetical protein
MLLFPKEQCDLENEHASHTKCGWMDGIVKATFRKQKTPLFIKNIVQNTDYQILTSNEGKLRKLNYQHYCKDQFPTINVNVPVVEGG